MRKAASAALGESVAQGLLEAYQPSRDGWLVVPVVGRRGDPVADIARRLGAGPRRHGATRGRPRNEVKSARELIDGLHKKPTRDRATACCSSSTRWANSWKAPQPTALTSIFFQELAEAASRAQGRLVIVGILHQAFEQYASRLGRETRDEWAKIQGRFTDVPLIAGVDEVVDLLGRAIVCRTAPPETAGCRSDRQSIRSRRPARRQIWRPDSTNAGRCTR